MTILFFNLIAIGTIIFAVFGLTDRADVTAEQIWLVIALGFFARAMAKILEYLEAIIERMDTQIATTKWVGEITEHYANKQP